MFCCLVGVFCHLSLLSHTPTVLHIHPGLLLLPSLFYKVVFNLLHLPPTCLPVSGTGVFCRLIQILLLKLFVALTC